MITCSLVHFINKIKIKNKHQEIFMISTKPFQKGHMNHPRDYVLEFFKTRIDNLCYLSNFIGEVDLTQLSIFFSSIFKFTQIR